MEKADYVKISNEKINDPICKNIMIGQIEKYYLIKDEYNCKLNNYNIGEDVILSKGTLLHGTYKNIDGLKEIVKDGLISSWFIDGRMSKYPSSVGVWNLKQEYKLVDYINFYSGGTIKYTGLLENGEYGQNNKSEIISFEQMNNINDIVINNPCRMWYMEQTKEARFMPSLVQNQVQIGIIFNGSGHDLTKGDILSDDLTDEQVKEFVNSNYYERFLVDRKNKDDFFTDRESAILFGLPSCLIEGILVGRDYEKKQDILNEIKKLLPNCYICNLDGNLMKTII